MEGFLSYMFGLFVSQVLLVNISKYCSIFGPIVFNISTHYLSQLLYDPKDAPVHPDRRTYLLSLVTRLPPEVRVRVRVKVRVRVRV